MMKPGSLAWFARHELRLVWRDTIAMMTAGRRSRGWKVAVGFILFIVFMHGAAFITLGAMVHGGPNADRPTLIALTVAGILSGSAMLSQAMETVTRTFYMRSDLELILSSPSPVTRVFVVRIAAMALSVGAMSIVLIGPFFNVLAWEHGPRWLGGYGVIAAISMVATALAVVLTVQLFKLIGPKRTRPVAQIAAAVVGGAFVIGLQMAAILSTGTTSRFAFLNSDYVLRRAPRIDSPIWWPARAALGEWSPMVVTLAVALMIFFVVTRHYAPRFATFAIAASGAANTTRSNIRRGFRVRAGQAALRWKERLLLMRDPWLISQSLMQVLYLLPPAVLLWRGAAQANASVILVPVLVMSAGQLAGGLAWLTISGEDAPELVATAPITQSRVLRAKIEAVLECVAILFAPFVLGLALLSPERAGVAAIFIALAAMSSAAIQFWFRSQAKRNQFRRRHASSRIATFAEAFSSIGWAGTGAVTAAAGWTGAITALLPLAVLGCARLFSPAAARR